MLRQLVQEQGTILSLALVAVILGFAAAGHIYIRKREQEDNALEHRGFIEMIPSLVSTLGVLGTFAGITLGLLFFDTGNLAQSIPLLLNGLKTAFFTSLAGMIGSLVLSSKVNDYDKQYMHVHHINGDKLNNDESNLRCLCVYCHAHVDDHHFRRLTRGANKVSYFSFIDRYADEGYWPIDESDLRKARNYMQEILRGRPTINITIENHFDGEIDQLTINSE